MEKPVLVHYETFKDLDHGATVKAMAERCKTTGGTRVLAEIMSSPIYCKKTLRERADDIAAFRNTSVDLDSLKNEEEGAVWCATEFDDLDEDTIELLEEPYFRNVIARGLNKLWPALWANNAYAVFAAPAMALSAPVAYLVTPYLMIRFKLKIPLDFKTFIKLMYHSFKGAGAAMNIAFGNAPSFAMQLASVAMTVVVYCQNVLASFRHSFSLVSVCKKVTTKMNCLARFLEKCDEVVDAYQHPLYSRWMVCDKPAANSGPTPSIQSEQILPWKTGFAKALCQFRSLDRKWIRARMRQLFCVDALHAISASVTDFSMKPVSYLPSRVDALLIRNGRRLHEGDVPNSVAMIRGKNGIVLTGQNASGKSTVLRMTGCVVLLAQTVGWVPAAACALEPFKYITTMMGIRDDPEAGRSRFQNELLRAGECVEAARRRPNDAGLLLMDEIFGGTDPAQGDACGGKILTSLTETPGCMYILATHQKGLVEHSKTLDGVMRFKMLPDSYKLAPGVNDSYNASDLYEKSGIS
nr:DNA mismatch repair ATPase MutS subfamily 8 [Oceanusvirus sp.]